MPSWHPRQLRLASLIFHCTSIRHVFVLTISSIGSWQKLFSQKNLNCLLLLQQYRGRLWADLEGNANSLFSLAHNQWCVCSVFMNVCKVQIDTDFLTYGTSGSLHLKFHSKTSLLTSILLVSYFLPYQRGWTKLSRLWGTASLAHPCSASPRAPCPRGELLSGLSPRCSGHRIDAMSACWGHQLPWAVLSQAHCGPTAQHGLVLTPGEVPDVWGCPVPPCSWLGWHVVRFQPCPAVLEVPWQEPPNYY